MDTLIAAVALPAASPAASHAGTARAGAAPDAGSFADALREAHASPASDEADTEGAAGGGPHDALAPGRRPAARARAQEAAEPRTAPTWSGRLDGGLAEPAAAEVTELAAADDAVPAAADAAVLAAPPVDPAVLAALAQAVPTGSAAERAAAAGADKAGSARDADPGRLALAAPAAAMGRAPGPDLQDAAASAVAATTPETVGQPAARHEPGAARAAAPQALRAEDHAVDTTPAPTEGRDAPAAGRVELTAMPMLVAAQPSAVAPASTAAILTTPEVPDRTIEPELASPRFAPALGAQITLLAGEGVREARLQVHPAEMGPITVHIALDGLAARVDFVAEAPATRQVLEASLPALAGALRESGLTLAGGGVFQQGGGSRGRGDGQPAPGTPAAKRADAGDDVGRVAAGIAAAPRARRGLVDIVA